MSCFRVAALALGAALALPFMVLAEEAAKGAETLSPAMQQRIDEAVQRALALERAGSEAARPSAPPKAADDAVKYVESNVVSAVGREGFSWQDRQGQFLFHPYVLVQTRLQFLRVDDEGLELSDRDNFVDLGFGLPNAILGVAGKAFEKLSFNFALNGPCAGKGCLMNEAWLEGNLSDAVRLRMGKFKVPMNWHVQTRLAGRLAPSSPNSLSARVNIPFDINAVNPVIASGFDLGLMMHGLVRDRLQYQVGVFNGEGVGVNTPTSTLSDDSGLPALLYAGRIAWVPFGPLPLEERAGGPGATKLLVGASVSYNAEANAESSSDLRAGLELVLSAPGWYWATEAYLLHMDYMERMKNSPNYLFWGANTILARSLGPNLEPFVRLDAYDRNSVEKRGLLLMPAVGLKWYLFEQNLNLQAMYEYLTKIGHEDELSANDDDNSMAEHSLMAMLQFAF